MQLDEKQAEQLPKIIYIMGTARSGSTILSLLLSSSADVFAAGELTSIVPDGFVENKKCSCGKTANHCAIWGKVKKNLNMNSTALNETALLFKKIEWHDGLFKQLFGIFSNKDLYRYKKSNVKLLSAIKKNSDCSVIIDSSKYAGRALALQNISDLKTLVICLTRSPKGLVHSFKKKNKFEQKSKSIVSVLAYYFVTLISFRIASCLLKNNLHYLTYEELIEDPVYSLNKIREWSGLDLTESIQRLNKQEDFEIGHMITANRLRKKKKVKFNPDLSLLEGSSLHGFVLTNIMNLYGRVLGFIKK